ncbi:GNAT family N-acetyltransferase [Microlunatus sp. GCM10028923]|uniref:GNAT family N-acetyltransferase n=1 Tax=Microlunatus sp. GCM10028923 TaxID=3273400 RepID=UPI00362330F8
MNQSANPVVERVDARHRYEISVDGARAGMTEYRDRGSQRIFFHTEVDEAYAGQGLAGELVQQALTDTRAAGLRVVPVCAYVTRFVKRHPEFADLADPVTADVLSWLERELG